MPRPVTACLGGITIAIFHMVKLSLSELGDLLKATVSKNSSYHLSSTYSVLDTRQRDLCALSYLPVISTLCLSPEATHDSCDTSQLLLKQRGAVDGDSSITSQLT